MGDFADDMRSLEGDDLIAAAMRGSTNTPPDGEAGAWWEFTIRFDRDEIDTLDNALYYASIELDRRIQGALATRDECPSLRALSELLTAERASLELLRNRVREVRP